MPSKVSRSAWRRILGVQSPQNQNSEDRPTESDGDTLCSICNSISFYDLFNDESKSAKPFQWDLATVRNETQCKFCKLLRGAIDRSPALLNVTEGQIGLAYMFHGMNIHEGSADSDPTGHGDIVEPSKWVPRERTLVIRDGSDMYSEDQVHYNIVPMGEYGDSIRFRSSRVIDPQFFNLGLVREWLETCTSRHRGHCMPTTINATLRDVFRVIDVKEKTLVQKPQGCEYLALSYVWAKVQQPKLERLELNCWTKPGGLGSLKLPNTITDAMELTRQLSKRYLWVDCLCIVQDDEQEKLRQISQMHSIYRSAWMTIIAASGKDSNAGLSGLSTRPRSAYQGIETIQGLSLATIESDPFQRIEESVWNSRAWTFQEKLCSSRCLIITERCMTFWCTKTRWREDLYLETRDLKEIHHAELDPISGFVDNDASMTVEKVFDFHFTFILSTYLLRQLTYPSDILHAFAGTSQLMSPALGHFISGLPSNWFYRSLCWEHKYKIIRRPGPFPSWCWSGWMHHPSYRINHYMLSDAIMPVLTIVRCGGGDRQHHLDTIAADKGANVMDKAAHPHFQFNFNDLKAAWDPFSSAGSESIVLLFYTSSAHLLIGPAESLSLEPWDPGRSFNGDGEILDLYPLLNPTTNEEIGTIVLDKEWYTQNANKTHEFIVVARHKMAYQSWENDAEEKKFMLMLIVRDSNGWAERIQVSPLVKEQKWWDCCPKRSLIILA